MEKHKFSFSWIFYFLLGSVSFVSPLYSQSTSGNSTGTDDVFLPDLTTVIEGEDLEIFQEALPDYYATLPAVPLKPEPSVAEAPVEEEIGIVPPSVVEVARAEPPKQFFFDGFIEPAWPLSLATDFSVHTLGDDAFFLDLGYKLVGGYGLERAEDGFFHNKSFLRVGKTFAPGSAWIKVEGNYKSMDNGLQGKSLLFDDINRRGAGAGVKIGLPLGYGFSLEGEIPLDWYNRYAGFSNTVGKLESNGSIALSVLDINPNMVMKWNSLEVSSIPQNHNISTQMNIGWNYWASLHPEINASGNRWHFGVGASWLYNSWLEIFSNINLVYLPAGSGLDTNKLLVPFSLGSNLSLSHLNVSLEGGLDSTHKNYYALEELEPYVNFTVHQLFTYSEKTDWFIRGQVEVPLFQEKEVSNLIFDNLVLDIQAEYRKSAFGNNLLTGNYSAGIDGWTGLFSAGTQDRSSLSTDVAVTARVFNFLIKAGWNGQWLYHPDYLPPQNLVFSCNYTSSSHLWGAEVNAVFGFEGQDSVPMVGASACYKPTENLQVVLGLKDMVKLFAAKQRVFIEPYVKEGGSVSVSLQFNF